MSASDRVSFEPVEGASEVFTPEFCDALAAFHDGFTSRMHELRAKRQQALERALKQGAFPAHLPPSPATTTAWSVSPMPEELRSRGIEISGPASITSMFINALNAGPEGERAEGDLDDDEDSAGHRLVDTVQAAINRMRAVERTLAFHNPESGRTYAIQDGAIPFFMHRERGLMLDEPDVKVDGAPVPACILGTALTLFYAGRAQAQRGQGIYFYLPKMELVEEAALWKDFFDLGKRIIHWPSPPTIKAIILVESLPMVYQMEESLHALGEYGAGLNAARWDLKASILEFVMADPNHVWPDRFGVDIKTTDFIANIFRRLVAVCLKHNAVPIGGMATALPSRDDAVNQAAAAAIHADKEWEAHQGFLRGWVAHIYHMKTAADPFKELRASGWQPTPQMRNPENYPVELRTPEGAITLEGSRRNVRAIIEYVEGWLDGRGAKSIDTLAGRPGVHPALMEDLATGRISVAQTAQRIIHHAKASDTGEAHDFPVVRRLFQQEAEDILAQLKATIPAGDEGAAAAYAQSEARYRKAAKIGMRWVKNYTELNFRSLGSYTRADLDVIAAAPDVF